MNALEQNAANWFTPARFGFLTACLLFACFPGVILGRETFFFRDFAIFSYPLASYHRECFWRGELPLWNPYNDCGLPFLAQWNTMVLYPLSLIYLLLPLTWSLSFFCLFHMWLGGQGMFYLARSWTGNHLSAALAGLGFIFGGVILSCLKWPNNIAALGWMPWVILAVERACSGNMREVAVAAIVGALQMLSGAPEVIVLTWILAGALMLLEVMNGRRKATRILRNFVIVLAWVAGLSAAQLLPFLDLLRHSQRDISFQGSQWPMPPWGWANFLLPLFRMFPSYHDVHAQPGQYWISTYYVAIPVVLLGIVAFIKVRTPKVWLLGALILFSMWMALGERALLYKWLRAWVPGLGMMRFPIKFIVLAAFILPLLGALGLKAVLSAENNSRRAFIWLPATILVCALSALIIYSELNPYIYSLAFVTTQNGILRIAVVTMSAFLLMALVKRGFSGRGAFACLGLMVVVVFDSLTHTTWQNPTAPQWVYDGAAAEIHPRPRLGQGRAMISPEAADRLDHLKLDEPAEDVLSSRLSLYCNVNLIERIPKVDGFYAIYPRQISRLQDLLYTGTNLPPAGLLDFAGVTHVTASGTWNKWELREGALPWVTSPRRARAVSQRMEALLEPRFTPRKEVLVTQEFKGTANYSEAEISALEWQPQRISFRSSAPQESLVVLSQTFYHCWKATIDGRPAEIFPANIAFQGLSVPAGEHTISLVYKDAAFRAGLVVSVISLGLVAPFIVRPRKVKNECSA